MTNQDNSRSENGKYDVLDHMNATASDGLENSYTLHVKSCGQCPFFVDPPEHPTYCNHPRSNKDSWLIDGDGPCPLVSSPFVLKVDLLSADQNSNESIASINTSIVDATRRKDYYIRVTSLCSDFCRLAASLYSDCGFAVDIEGKDLLIAWKDCWVRLPCEKHNTARP